MIGILLAAGFSRRFGTADKLTQKLPDGRLMALTAAENLIQAVPLSIAVLRPDNLELAGLMQKAGLKVVFCSEQAQGMADSLSTAVRFSAGYSEADSGYVIALADMPYITPSTISKISSALDAGAAIAAPVYHGRRGHPVGFSAKFRHALEQLSGDEGARSILKRHGDELVLLTCDDPGVIADIDTPADLMATPRT